jgi:hypothetical protein
LTWVFARFLLICLLLQNSRGSERCQAIITRRTLECNIPNLLAHTLTTPDRCRWSNLAARSSFSQVLTVHHLQWRKYLYRHDLDESEWGVRKTINNKFDGIIKMRFALCYLDIRHRCGCHAGLLWRGKIRFISTELASCFEHAPTSCSLHRESYFASI